MIVGAQHIVGNQGIPAIEGLAPLLSQAHGSGYVMITPLPEPVAEQLPTPGRQTQPPAFSFLLVMAAISGARDAGAWALADLLRAWFGVVADPSAQFLVLQLAISLVGIGVAARFSKATSDPAVRRHMLGTLLAALGIGLILALWSYLVGHASALSWLLVPVYLLWAWAEAVSGPRVPGTGTRSAQV